MTLALPPFVSPTRHPKYYLQEAPTTFLVENQLFRVHRTFLERESDFFKALFSLPLPTCRTVEGTGDNNPIPLPGVTVEEFEALLDSLYQRNRGTQCSREHWIHLLSISSRYDFDNIRALAIREISSFNPPLDPILLADLAVRHDVDGWLERAYISLCYRQCPLTESEAHKIGLTVASKIGRCRAKLTMTSPKTYNPPGFCPSSGDELTKKIVREIFWPYDPSSL